MAAVTNYHKLSSLNDGTVFAPNSGGQKSEVSITGPKSRHLQGHTTLGALGEYLFFTSPVAVTSSVYVPLHLTSSVCVKSPPGPLSRIHVAVSGPIHLIQDPLHISRFLITSAKTLFPHKVTFSFQGSEPGIFGSQFSAHHRKSG